MVIRRIAPLSAAKIAGLVYALIGLPFALLVWGVSATGLSNAGLRDSPFAPQFGLAAGAATVVALPLLYGAVGFFMTLIGAWLYNTIAGLVGGLSIDLEPESPPDTSPGIA